MINVITPQEVRKLPEGSKVREHSIDRQGYPQYLDLTIDHSKGFRLLYRDYYGMHQERKLRYFKPNDTYRYYELIERKEGSMKIKLHSQYDHFPNCQTDGNDFDLELCPERAAILIKAGVARREAD